MNNKKFIIIIISLILIFGIIFIFLYTQKSKQPDKTQENRAVLETDTIKKTSEAIISTLSNTENQTVYESTLTEDETLSMKIKSNLSNWEITREKELIIQSVEMSSGHDNEALMEVWIPFMKKNSKEILNLVDTSKDKIKFKARGYFIFDWFINNSGEYEKLSKTKQQEILGQFNQLKSE